MLTMRERASTYNHAFDHFPASHLHVVTEGARTEAHDVLYGTWVLGNNYRAATALYRAYPPGLLKRLGALFPSATRILHAFSGSLPPGNYVRLDCNPDRFPDVLGDVCDPPFATHTFDVVYADPPYSPEDAVRYDTPMVNRSAALLGIGRVLQPGGFLIWLDCVLPMYAKSFWRVVGRIAIVRSTNHRIRMVTIFERLP